MQVNAVAPTELGTLHGGVAAVAPDTQALQVQPVAPALDCARRRMSDPPRVARKPLTVRTPLLQVCSLTWIVRMPLGPRMSTGVASQLGVKASGVCPG